MCVCERESNSCDNSDNIIDRWLKKVARFFIAKFIARMQALLLMPKNLYMCVLKSAKLLLSLNNLIDFKHKYKVLFLFN